MKKKKWTKKMRLSRKQSKRSSNKIKEGIYEIVRGRGRILKLALAACNSKIC